MVSIKEKAMDWMNAWQDIKILDNKSFKELIAFEKNSLWWFIHPVLYFTIENIIRQIEKGNKINKIRLRNLKLFFGKNYMNFRDFVRRRMYEKKREESVEDDKKTRILMVSTTRYWMRDYDIKTKSTKKNDVILGSIIEKLKEKDYNISCIDIDYTNKGNFNVLKEKIRDGWVPFEYYFNGKTKERATKKIKEIKRIWKKLRKSNDFKSSLKYKEIKLWPFLESRFKQIFSSACIYKYVHLIETAKEIIEREKPNVIVMALETGYYARALTLAARKKGVPTIGIQHGVISPTNHAYVHKKITVSLPSLDCPVPDKTAVYGNYTKKILTKISSYPQGSVIVTGSPRYDLLYNMKKIFNKKDFCKKYGLDTNKKIVLITTQALNNKEEKEKFLRNTVRALNEIKGVQIVIKPKPDENENFHKKILKEENIKATIILKNSNTYEAILACDLMMTVYSTTAIEAMILNKSVVIVNLTKEPDQMPYVRFGAAIGVYEVKELLQRVKQVLCDNAIKKELKIKMKKFVDEHAYKIDGKATDRVVKLIRRVGEK
jgi:hypothetical protein